jgi:Carboxypeptidase regulatory-like domain
MPSQKARFAIVLCSLVCLFSPLLHSQATASFSGTVTDNSGAVVAGVKVTVTAQATNASREAMTDATGHYTVPQLGVGLYTIHVEMTGFKTVETKDARLQVDEQREFDFSLIPASVSTSVQVNATEVAVETTNATLGQVITSQEVAELPLNGRNFVQLATLTPGTTAETNPTSFFNGAASSEASTRGSFSLSVGGSRAQSTDWMLDGNDNNQLDEGGIGIFSSIDSIQEFKVLTYNYSAEFGERAGPTVLVTTKSGSNQWHGSLFEFFRNTKLNAHTYDFGNKSPNQQFNLNQFGGSLGGPIQKDKTFFFADWQAKMQRRGIPFNGTVPTAGMTTPDANGNYDFTQAPSGAQLNNPFDGIPFQCVPNTLTPEPVSSVDGSQPNVGNACNILPAALVSPIGANIVKLYPAPNATASGFNYANSPVRRLNEGTGDIRVDHTFSSKDTIFGRFSYDQATNFVPGGSPGYAETNAFGSNQFIDNHGRNAAISEQHIFSPNMINEASFGFNRIFNHILSFRPGSCQGAIEGIPGSDLGAGCDSITGYPASLNQSTKDCVSCGMTSFLMSSYMSLGDRGYAPYQGGTNVYSVTDTLNLIRGRHQIHFGATFRANQMNIRNNAFQDGFAVEAGTETGDDIADVLLGSFGVFAAHDQTFLGATVGRRYKMFRPYFQDDWRVTNNLTLNLGLAWALVTPESEVQHRQSNFDIATLQWYVPSGSPGLTGCTNCVASDGRAGIQLDKKAFEPRIGLAWKPLGSNKTVVRAGYAIFHDSAWNQGGQGLWQNPPYYAEVDPPTFLFGFGSSAGALGGGFLLPSGTPSTTDVAGGAVYSGPVNPSSYTGTIQSMNRNFRQGMIQQYNLNLERQIPGNVVLTAGYAGSKSTHILVSQANENLNQPGACPGEPGAVAGYTLGCGLGDWPYAAPFQSVDSNNSVGSARYDSLQLKAETKSSQHGIYALLGYTWSRTFDSGFPDGLGTNPGAIYYPLPGTAKLDWGLSQLNLNDSFTASILYDLPFGKGKHFGADWNGATNTAFGGWSVNVIERVTSGFPMFVVDSSNPSGVFFSYNGNTYSRPNMVGDPNKPGQEGSGTNCPTQIHTLSAWFNTCAFESALPGELGTAPRAPVYGPRFVNTDFSIIKNFPLSFREGMGLQFRAEFFNLFNHPQFYLQGGSGTGEQDVNSSSTYGVVTGTVNNPRLIQFALRLNF